MDATTGSIKWVFNSIPQGPDDDGWAIAKDTWIGGARNGGGMWYPPAINPALGMIYINTSNPDPAFEGTARKGMNLFTNSIVALRMDTGTMAWYFQAVHHDIWEMDQVTGPLLYDVTVDGRTVKGLASAGKNCFLYLFNRETGQPINPMVETVVPTNTDMKGEEIWPTQPFPYTSRGVPQLPFCETYPMGIKDADLNNRRRQLVHPLLGDRDVCRLPRGLEFRFHVVQPADQSVVCDGKEWCHVAVGQDHGGSFAARGNWRPGHHKHTELRLRQQQVGNGLYADTNSDGLQSGHR